MAVEANVAATKASRDIIEWIKIESMEHKGEAKVRFYKRIADHVLSQLPENERPARIVEAAIVPMTVAEVIKFNQRIMPFGAHQGKKVCEISLDYLEWLNSSGDFQLQLRRYMASKSVRAEVDMMEEAGQ